MSVDRFGLPIVIGWAAHEMVWLAAALETRLGERTAAFQDIADMSGRSLEAVRRRANGLLEDQRAARFMAGQNRRLGIKQRR